MKPIISSIADEPILDLLQKEKDLMLHEIRDYLKTKGIVYKDRTGLIHRMNSLISKGCVEKTLRLDAYPFYNIVKRIER